MLFFSEFQWGITEKRQLLRIYIEMKNRGHAISWAAVAKEFNSTNNTNFEGEILRGRIRLENKRYFNIKTNNSLT